ncbi:Wzz/FepE/Etk N-terminal domain-containing protein [Lactobacillaceae bacterium L1_55_11]|nr:Wzz/FepE/Etk N-terminal domain-containing protein [Lactobacillaceae bacterium L1_55_11]
MENIFDLKLLVKMVRREWLKILAIAFLFALAFFAYAKIFVTPQYQATVSLLVNKKNDHQDSTNDEQQAAVAIINTYKDIISRPVISDKVAQNLATWSSDNPRYYPGLTGGEVSKMVNTASQNNSQVFSINVKAPSPRLAADVANEVARVFQSEIAQIMDAKSVTVISKATPNNQPISPKIKRMTFLGFVIGLVLAFVVYLIRFLWLAGQDDNHPDNPADKQGKITKLPEPNHTTGETRLQRYSDS